MRPAIRELLQYTLWVAGFIVVMAVVPVVLFGVLVPIEEEGRRLPAMQMYWATVVFVFMSYATKDLVSRVRGFKRDDDVSGSMRGYGLMAAYLNLAGIVFMALLMVWVFWNAAQEFF